MRLGEEVVEGLHEVKEKSCPCLLEGGGEGGTRLQRCTGMRGDRDVLKCGNFQFLKGLMGMLKRDFSQGPR